MQKLLNELSNKENRIAQFRTIITLNMNGNSHSFEGICKGTILQKKSGYEGFGYDPIFQPNGYNQSFAEMSSTDKNKISHRGLAVEKLVSFLNS